MNEMIRNEASVHLPFEKISNCRDLAGMCGTEGKVIRPSKLFRSGKLSSASELDCAVLSELGISDIVDLRTEWERMLERDKDVEGAANHHDPVLHEKDLKKMAGSQRKLAGMVIKDSRKLMNDAYADMALSPDAVTAWKKFFDILLQAKGGVLWHCTQGKDRTGAAAILLEHALGADEKTIFDDYMQTNLYMNKDAQRDRMMASAVFSHNRPVADTDIDSYMFAHRSYYDSFCNAVLDHYGSWDRYLHDALDLTDEKIELLRSKYLIQ